MEQLATEALWYRNLSVHPINRGDLVKYDQQLQLLRRYYIPYSSGEYTYKLIEAFCQQDFVGLQRINRNSFLLFIAIIYLPDNI